MIASPRILVFAMALFFGVCLWACAFLMIVGCGVGGAKGVAAQYEAEQIACIAKADSVQGISNEEKRVMSQLCRNDVKARYGRLDGGGE